MEMVGLESAFDLAGRFLKYLCGNDVKSTKRRYFECLKEEDRKKRDTRRQRFSIPRAPSTSSEGIWTLQTHLKHLRNEGTWSPKACNMSCFWCNCCLFRVGGELIAVGGSPPPGTYTKQRKL